MTRCRNCGHLATHHLAHRAVERGFSCEIPNCREHVTWACLDCGCERYEPSPTDVGTALP